MDVRWDNGFITDENEYIQRRLELQQELERLTPVAHEELEEAANCLQNFSTYWTQSDSDPQAQHNLIRKMVERVYVQEGRIAAVTLNYSYHLVLGHKMKGPTEFSADPFMYTCGSDGI